MLYNYQKQRLRLRWFQGVKNPGNAASGAVCRPGKQRWICRKLLPAKIVALIGSAVEFREVKDGETFEAGGLCLQCFDIASTKEKQFGFRTQLPDGQSFVCLGDEPYNVINRSYVENADWLLCEAFCLYEDREVFQPYHVHTPGKCPYIVRTAFSA